MTSSVTYAFPVYAVCGSRTAIAEDGGEWGVVPKSMARVLDRADGRAAPGPSSFTITNFLRGVVLEGGEYTDRISHIGIETLSLEWIDVIVVYAHAFAEADRLFLQMRYADAITATKEWVRDKITRDAGSF